MSGNTDISDIFIHCARLGRIIQSEFHAPFKAWNTVHIE